MDIAASPNPKDSKGIRLAEGVKRSALWAAYVSCFFGIMLAILVSINQDFVFTTFLKIPTEKHGRVGGSLQGFRELIVVVFLSLGGLLADRVGRRFVFGTGFLFLSAGFVLFPTATSVTELGGYYAVSAVGAAFITVMGSLIVGDLVVNESRGRASGIQNFMIGIGGLIAILVLKRLPKIFTDGGRTVEEAGRMAYWVYAGLGVLAAAIVFLFLRYQTQVVKAQRPPLLLLREGFAAAKSPGILLSYIAAFVSRGDLVVIGTFVTLWTNKAALAGGMNAADAAAKGGAVLGAAGVVQLFSAPLIGWMTDKLDRVRALQVAAVIGAIAYLAMFFIHDPLSRGMMFVMMGTGVAQMAGIITSQVLLVEQAPAQMRGVIAGTFGIFGAIAQIGLAWAGGILFDTWREAGPFVIVGLLNLGLVVACQILRPRVLGLKAS